MNVLIPKYSQAAPWTVKSDIMHIKGVFNTISLRMVNLQRVSAILSVILLRNVN